MEASLLVTLEIVISAGLVVLIWLIQVLHYPAFLYFEPSQFKEAMAFHQSRISFVVIPLMVTELGLSGFFLWTDYNALRLMSSFCVLGVWLATFLLQVPLHDKLLREGKNETCINSLTQTNWVRTILWTFKLIILTLKT